MGLWSFYFLGKLYLYMRGHICFNFILNSLFAIFIILPLPKIPSVHKYLKVAKFSLGLIFAFILLWYDSWLPPFFHSVKLLMETEGIAAGYIFHFITNTVLSWETAVLILILIICILLRNRIKLAPVVFILMLIVPLLEWGKTNKEDLGTYLEAFYRSESKRIIHFEQPKTSAPDFDILIFHICSLSWDDLGTIGMEDYPFLKQFNYLFTKFNTVSSYTNPSIIRLLRTNCGQQSHGALYQDAPKECFLLERLRALDYETYSAVDNDAPPSSHFVYDMIHYALTDPPLDFKDIPVLQYDFDNTPIHDDLALFKKWWALRQKSMAKRAVLYFDITTLHTGAHWINEKDWWKRDQNSHYKESLSYLSGIFETIFHELTSSGRNFVIVFVTEHGAALRGNKLQAPQLRDIPLPQITLVPVGIKLIGKGHPSIPEHQEIISKPTSYLALSYMLSHFIKEPPFGDGPLPSQKILDDIPETNFVSETKEATVIKIGEDYFLYGKEKKWRKLSLD